MASITDHEAEQIASANATGRTPVVFVHGLWLLASSWEPWAALFEEAGYAAVMPGWPDDPETVAQARANPKALAGKTVGRVAAHFNAHSGQVGADAGKQLLGGGAVKQQMLHRVADGAAGVAGFGVDAHLAHGFFH